MEISATPFGIRHVMSRDFRKLLEDIAESQRRKHWSREGTYEALSVVVAIWLPKSSCRDKSLLSRVENPGEIDKFIAANRQVIDAAIEGLVD